MGRGFRPDASEPCATCGVAYGTHHGHPSLAVASSADDAEHVWSLFRSTSAPVPYVRGGEFRAPRVSRGVTGSSGGKYRVHPPFAPEGSTFPVEGTVPRHTIPECDELCGCGQVTCPCMESAECFDRNYYCCDGRMKKPANCISLRLAAP